MGLMPGKEHFGGAVEDGGLEAGDPSKGIAMMGDRSQVGAMQKEKS